MFSFKIAIASVLLMACPVIAEDNLPSLPSHIAGATEGLDCQNGVIGACLNYAMYLIKEQNDYRGYRLAIEKGCIQKDLKCCDRIEFDDREGEAIRVKCESGESEACYIYALGLLRMFHRTEDSLKYLQKGCELGDKELCKIKVKIQKKLEESL